MEMAIKLGKPVNPKLHIGICGEHGGDPSSVEFCHKIGLDYVSCSPFRVPIARLAAAQAAIAEDKANEKRVINEDTAKDVKEVASQAAGVAKDVAKDVAEAAKETAENVKDVAKAGLAGIKAGWKEAKKTYKQSK